MNQANNSKSTSRSTFSLLKGILTVSALVLLVYGVVITDLFLWDDEQFVLKNTFLTSSQFLSTLLTKNIVAGVGMTSNIYRPLQSFTHFLDVQLWGYEPFGHHLSNLLLFWLMSCSVYLLLRRLFSEWPALIATLFFVLHPLLAGPVGYISGRGDILGILFLSMGILLFYRNTALSLFCAIMAMAAKENMVLFPGFLFLYDRMLLKERKPYSASVRKLLPYFSLSAFYVLLRLTFLNFNNTLNFYDKPNLLTENFSYRIATYMSTLPKGINLWLFPYDIHHERYWNVYSSLGYPQSLVGVDVFLALVFATFGLRKTMRPVAMGSAWFLLATVPTSNIFVLINALFYDHWFILPGLGLIFGLGYLLEQNWAQLKVRNLFLVGLSIYGCGMLFFTYQQNKVWHDPVSLYSHILRWEPGSVKIMNNLAMSYAEAGQLDEAITLYRRAISTGDVFPQTHHNLGMALLVKNDTDAADTEFERAVSMDPNFYQSWVQIGQIQLRRKKPNEAQRSFEKALAINPYSAEAKSGLDQSIRLSVK